MTRSVKEERYFDRLSDNTVWPAIDNDLAWIMRYGRPEHILEIRALVSEMLVCYTQLVRMPMRQRNAVCSELRAKERERSEKAQ